MEHFQGGNGGWRRMFQCRCFLMHTGKFNNSKVIHTLLSIRFNFYLNNQASGSKTRGWQLTLGHMRQIIKNGMEWVDIMIYYPNLRPVLRPLLYTPKK